MFPPVNTLRPKACSTKLASSTVVVLPLDPVTARTGSLQNLAASSISAMTRSTGRSPSSGWMRRRGTPGLGTTQSASAKCAGSWAPKTISAPGTCPARRAASAWGADSSSRTDAPTAVSSRAAAKPERPAPTTAARLPASSRAQALFCVASNTSSPTAVSACSKPSRP